MDKVPVSELCEELVLRPTVFYRWQKELFENGGAAFQSQERPHRGSRAAKHRLDEPARLSLSMVASLQSLPPFHPAVHFSSAVLNFQFARLAGGTIPFIRRYSTI